ncbi:capsid protein [Bacillus subtilis]|uniref:capsid protein n=1 Tax=Bacillus subtilis TaxID=1423 RepID=UPI0011C7C532|nr:capsid protein [Bacillus subtilis]TXK63872.1 capsid protein [Bacillus subtilis]WVM73262.1 capsid protein [Bacillus subtilis]
MKEETKVLWEYVKLLKEINDSGYLCNRELKDALTSLHKSMGFEKNTKSEHTKPLNGNSYTLSSGYNPERIAVINPGREETTFLIIDLYNSRIEDISKKVEYGTFKHQASQIKAVIIDKRPSKLIIDANGIGKGLLDALADTLKGTKAVLSENGALTYK